VTDQNKLSSYFRKLFQSAETKTKAS